MSDSPWVESARADDPKRHLNELANLYEVARALIGARDQRQIATRIVLSGMGTLGLRSGAMFVADDKGRFTLLASAGVSDHDPGESIAIPSAPREWLLREGVFALATAGAARGLGPLRDRLVERFDASVGATISDRHGLLALLESFASLAGRACSPPGCRSTPALRRCGAPRRGRPARSRRCASPTRSSSR